MNQKRMFEDGQGNTNISGMARGTFGYDNWATQSTLKPTQPIQQSQQSQQTQPIQQSQQSQQTQQSQQPYIYQTEKTNPAMASEEADALMEEIHQLTAQASQLEKRASFAEDGYVELKNLKETEAMRHFMEYKELVEKRRHASKVELQSLHDLVEEQEQHITRLTTQLVQLHAELALVKSRHQIADTSQQERSDIRKKDLQKQMNEYQEKYLSSRDQVVTLKAKMETLRQEIQEKKSLELHNKVELKPLRDKIKFFQALTGLTIVDYEKGPWDTYKCEQLGRNGSLHYKLMLFENNTGESMVRYSPLLDDMDDTKLPLFLKYDLEFEKKDASSFFSRITKFLNNKQTST